MSKIVVALPVMVEVGNSCLNCKTDIPMRERYCTKCKTKAEERHASGYSWPRDSLGQFAFDKAYPCSECDKTKACSFAFDPINFESLCVMEK